MRASVGEAVAKGRARAVLRGRTEIVVAGCEDDVVEA